LVKTSNSFVFQKKICTLYFYQLYLDHKHGNAVSPIESFPLVCFQLNAWTHKQDSFISIWFRKLNTYQQ